MSLAARYLRMTDGQLDRRLTGDRVLRRLVRDMGLFSPGAGRQGCPPAPLSIERSPFSLTPGVAVSSSDPSSSAATPLVVLGQGDTRQEIWG